MSPSFFFDTLLTPILGCLVQTSRRGNPQKSVVRFGGSITPPPPKKQNGMDELPDAQSNRIHLLQHTLPSRWHPSSDPGRFNRSEVDRTNSAALEMDAVQEYPRSMDAILLPILACLSLVLAVPPFAWHLKNRNVAACSLIFWVTLANVFVFINAMLWPTDDVQNWWNGVGLCDVEVKLTWAFSVGACGSLACIMRNLAGVLNVDRGAVMSTQAQRRRQALVDLVWCYACPIYIMAVDYVVQAGRYYIFTIAGCTPAVDNSWATVFLIFIWAPIFSVVGSYYCGRLAWGCE